jgi:hypothetical protein
MRPRIGRTPAPMTAAYAAAVRHQQAWVAAENSQLVGLAVLVPRPDHLLLGNVAVLPARPRVAGSVPGYWPWPRTKPAASV